VFDLFGWIRRRAAESVLAGLGDAAAAIATDDAPADLADLRARLAAALTPRALPAADEEPAKGRKGGVR